MGARKQFENAFGIKISKGKHIELLAMLLCIEVVLSFSYLGFIQLGPISITTLHILVIVAAMLFGPWDAMAVSLVFAFTSMWKATSTSEELGDIIFSPMKSGKPLESIIMTFGTRLLFALITGFIFRWFFSKKRKLQGLWISGISLVATGLHSVFVYVCMVVFFDASEVQTSTDFSVALLLNNLLLYVVSLAVVLLIYYLLKSSRIRKYFETIYENAKKSTRRDNINVIIIYAILVVISFFIALHFVSRLGVYIEENEQTLGTDYVNWTYSLVSQFIVGFVGIFGILALFVKWVQEYYTSIALEANKRALESAEEASKSKTVFLFNMSHDIRTPMNAILGYTDIGLHHINNEERVRDSLNKIKASGDHLLNLINDILEMSRIEAGRFELAETPIDIRETITSVDSMSQALAIPKSIDFKTVIGEISVPYVYADELHLNQVMINLISNAIKYTPEGGKVRYTVSQIGDITDNRINLRFEISDNGIGMSKEFQEHLFEAFSREEKSSVSKTEGAGLGLSIVKRIIDVSNGTISVSSEPGKGSVFTVDIPFSIISDTDKEELLSKQSSKPVIETDVQLQGKKVLLVEDNEMNREIANDLLDEIGLVVEDAENGEIAVNKVAEKGAEYYDFILMDIQMPVMGGYEATKNIRQLPNGNIIPIIALSANAFKEDIDRSIAAGMNAHIAKPINVDVLISEMKKLI